MTNRALLVVDMQNGFCHPDGSFSRIGMGLEGAQDAVRNAAVAVAQARRAAIPVVFTRHLYRPGRADEGAALTGNSPALAGINGLAAGSWDADVVDELGCGPEDLVVDKVRFDAFQWTSLEPLLRGLHATELAVCGVVTNLCVPPAADGVSGRRQRTMRRARRGAQPRCTSAAISCQSTWSATTSASGLGMPRRLNCVVRHRCTGRSSCSIASWAVAGVGSIVSPLHTGWTAGYASTIARAKAAVIAVSRHDPRAATGTAGLPLAAMRARIPQCRFLSSASCHFYPERVGAPALPTFTPAVVTRPGPGNQ
jgi:nicotinamidase-related amidase